MGTLAVDGSKIRANASKRKAMSYEVGADGNTPWLVRWNSRTVEQQSSRAAGAATRPVTLPFHCPQHQSRAQILPDTGDTR